MVAESSVGPESMGCVYVMERMENEDIIFAGGFGSVSVLFFNEQAGKLETLKNFEDIMSDEILDIKFYNNVLYALSPAQEEIAKLEFCFPNRKKSFNYGKMSEVSTYFKGISEQHSINVEELPEKTSQTKLSETGQLVFIGSNNFIKIAARDQQTGRFNLSSFPSSAMNYTVFKEIGGTHILYSDHNTNRFEFFDFNMNEIARISPDGV
jgi:hypothetical protein